ncbi:MAG TPA: nuclear transport factor 2 family protein [Longimicrobiaceae bacterium]|nr:nuclear transport factor 2 family protein [Longimicrobiaceae bacterium]
MHRSHAALAALLLVAACKVDRTPRSFYDRQPAAVDQDAAVNELRARVLAFANGLEKGNTRAAVSALSPSPDAVVFPLDGDDGHYTAGGEGINRALGELGVPAPMAARTPDLTVRANVKGNLGWFSTHLELLPMGAEGQFQRVRASGAFVRDGGEWHLAQIHLSRAAPLPAAVDSAAADSLRRDSARVDSARRDSTRREPAPRPAKPRTNRPR